MAGDLEPNPNPIPQRRVDDDAVQIAGEEEEVKPREMR